MKKVQLRSHHHCVYHLHLHLVLVTKYRRRCFTKDMLHRLHEICDPICHLWDVELLEFGGEPDHVHLSNDAKKTPTIIFDLVGEELATICQKFA